MALDTILIQRRIRQISDDESEARRAGGELIRQGLAKARSAIKELVARSSAREARLKAFSVPPRVIIDNESSNLFTVIEINGLDRIGLLYDLTEALFSLSLNIASAHITTFGERASTSSM